MKINSVNDYKIRNETQCQLTQVDPSDVSLGDHDKKQALEELKELTAKLDKFQELLYAQHQHKILIVLQGMDTSGKDGTIRSVFEGVNPQGVKVISFKVPTPEELDHDFLWRVHKYVPARGEIVVFNRSHYEDVLITRVHGLVSEKIWKKRFGHINDFEKMLVDEGTIILKFFLHISQEEQRQRLQERLDDKRKLWKFNPVDLKERKLWPDYMKAYQDTLSKTSTPYAPWYIIPANHKWYRNWVIASVIVNTLENLQMSYPKPKNLSLPKTIK